MQHITNQDVSSLSLYYLKVKRKKVKKQKKIKFAKTNWAMNGKTTEKKSTNNSVRTPYTKFKTFNFQQSVLSSNRECSHIFKITPHSDLFWRLTDGGKKNTSFPIYETKKRWQTVFVLFIWIIFSKLSKETKKRKMPVK